MPVLHTSNRRGESDWNRYLSKLLFCVGIAVAFASCAPSNSTGTYLAKFTNGLARLQLVQSGDHIVTGEIDWVVYDSNGALTSSSASATGAIDAQTVSLTFKGNGFLSGVSTGSGALGWNGLALTGDFNGGKVSTVTFTKSTEDQYQSTLESVQKAAQTIVAQRRLADQASREISNRNALIAEISNLTTRLQKFNDEAETHLQRWPNTEKSYLAITSDMQSKLNQERALKGDSNSFARGQISFAINQDEYSANQLHYSIQSLANSFSTNVVPSMTEAVKAKAICSSNSAPDVTDVCSAFSQVYETAQIRYRAVATGLDHLESVYQEQHRKHEEIIQSATEND